MRAIIMTLALSLGANLAAQDTGQAIPNPFEKDYPKAILHTSKGDITLELYEDQAPITVANFLDYARSGHYNGTIFHRVIGNFMIQGGGFDTELNLKPTKEPINNEANNGLRNERGTIAMARTTDPHSATAQFYINVVDNPPLDHRGTQSGRTWGYAVFGSVIEGMDVVDEIRFVETEASGMHQNLPIEPVIIESVEIP